MITRRILAAVAAAALVAATLPAPLVGQDGPGLIGGNAKKEAKKPYENYQVRARSIAAGQIVATTHLDAAEADFALRGLTPDRYMVELVNLRNGKVVCTEGPFELTSADPNRTGVVIDCQKVPVAWLLLGAAGAAGITAAVATGDSRSPSS
jgi:hypothetical protein